MKTFAALVCFAVFVAAHSKPSAGVADVPALALHTFVSECGVAMNDHQDEITVFTQDVSDRNFADCVDILTTLNEAVPCDALDDLIRYFTSLREQYADAKENGAKF